MPSYTALFWLTETITLFGLERPFQLKTKTKKTFSLLLISTHVDTIEVL